MLEKRLLRAIDAVIVVEDPFHNFSNSLESQSRPS